MNRITNSLALPGEEQPIGPKSTFIRLLKLGKPYTGWYIILCGLAAVISLTTVGLAETLRRIINAATSHDTSGLAAGMIFAAVIVVTDAGVHFLNTYLSGLLEIKSTSKLQISMLSRMLKLQMKDLDRYHSADLISRMNDSAPAAQQGINRKTIDLISNLLQIAFLLTYLLSLQFALTLGTILICSLVPLVMLPFTSRLRTMNEQRQSIESAQQAFVQDSVQGAEVVRAFSLAPRLLGQFNRRVRQFNNVHLPVSRIEAVGYNMPLAVILGGLLYVLSYGGYLVIGGRLDVGAVAAFLICFEQISNPVSKLANLWTELQSSLAQGKRLFEIMDLSEEDGNSACLKTAGVQDEAWTEGIHQTVAGQQPLTFSNVSFRYGQTKVLTDVHLRIEPGKVTAFAGASGSGKSTILQLMLATYVPDGGSIHHGSVPLQTIPPRSWRNRIAYVSQEPYLFSATLYENIAWGRPEASREEVIAAAQNAGIHEYIMRTPMQYETVIGERGLTLSGGERQRLSIARAFVRDPGLLLLDEPTAALDSHNEEIVQHALRVLMTNRTTVVVAHRLSTIRHADHICFMEAGAIAEQGTHGELMALQGKYHAMAQAGVQTEATAGGGISNEY
ncbi:ABC transporter ATP-binding protein [Paenibacillus sp. FSL R7-277]|uniref:ABC transporter ATP-binding protein n=1 Tax=Paenibacillus sp. FSL R7-277 TaxID=1227352 RepID=UPI0004ADF4E3|nr:ABC transporter ATP-binding protein [Paenibacillus sp. FSL R7-277]